MIHLEVLLVKKTPWTMVLQNQHPQPLFPVQFWWISTTGKIHRQGGQSHGGHEDNIHLVATLFLRFAQAGRTISINISVKIRPGSFVCPGSAIGLVTGVRKPQTIPNFKTLNVECNSLFWYLWQVFWDLGQTKAPVGKNSFSDTKFTIFNIKHGSCIRRLPWRRSPLRWGQVGRQRTGASLKIFGVVKLHSDGIPQEAEKNSVCV